MYQAGSQTILRKLAKWEVLPKHMLSHNVTFVRFVKHNGPGYLYEIDVTLNLLVPNCTIPNLSA